MNIDICMRYASLSKSYLCSKTIRDIPVLMALIMSNPMRLPMIGFMPIVTYIICFILPGRLSRRLKNATEQAAMKNSFMIGTINDIIFANLLSPPNNIIADGITIENNSAHL